MHLIAVGACFTITWRPLYNMVMLIQSRQLHDSPIVSMRTGYVVTRLQQPIIDPDKLEVCGFHTHQDNAVLLFNDVREITPKQAVIDDADVLSSPDDLHRLQEVLALDYQLPRKRTLTQSKQNLGTIEDYVIDTLSGKIQKLHVKQPLWRNFSGGTLIIDRGQILEVSDKFVLVSDAVIRAQHALNPQPPA